MSDAQRMAAVRARRKEEEAALLAEMDRLRVSLRALGSRGVFLPVTLVKPDGRQTLSALVGHLESMVVQVQKK